MIELLRSNDIVLIGAIEALLTSAGVGCFVADGYVSAVEGSIGAFPRRLMVARDDEIRARRLLTEAGFGNQLGP